VAAAEGSVAVVLLVARVAVAQQVEQAADFLEQLDKDMLAEMATEIAQQAAVVAQRVAVEHLVVAALGLHPLMVLLSHVLAVAVALKPTLEAVAVAVAAVMGVMAMMELEQLQEQPTLAVVVVEAEVEHLAALELLLLDT